MSTEKVTVARWDTNPAKTSIKDLRKELKLLKDEMVNLEEGSDAFLEIANKAGEIKHQIDEVNKVVGIAAYEFDDYAVKIGGVAAGLSGAFTAVNGALNLLGKESEAIDKAILKMQSLMAITQGLSTIPKAVKDLEDLRNAINGTTKAGKALKTVLQPKSLLLISTIITGIVLAFKNWEGAIRNALPFVDKICNAFGRVHPDIAKATEEQEKFNAKVREEYEIQMTEQERIASQAERIRKNRFYESLNDEAKKEYNKLQEDIILAQDNYNKLFNKRPEVVLSGDEFALRVLDAQLTAYKKAIKKAEEKLKELENNPIYKKKDTPNNPEKPTDDDDTISKRNEELDIELEKLKRNGKTEEENRDEIIRIETERLGLLKEGTLAYEKQQTLIYNLKNPIKEAKEEQKELTEEQKVWFKTYEEYSQLAFTQEEFFANQRSNLQRLLDEGLINLEQFKIAMNNLNKDVALWEKEQVVALVNNISNVVQASSGAISGFLNGLAEQQDTSNKKGFERQKRLQIAAATIQMLTGITTALSGAFTTKTGIWDWVLAGIQAASIAASGGLQINKIKNTKYDSGNTSIGSTPSVSSSAISASIIPPVQYSQMVQGANIEGKIGNSRVYVTENDIVDTIDKVTVQETENRY
ncbi:MAG: hypothetical protein II304_07235 [Bacteroidales bacterium]|nr:hypothetical protein [Bacteroidales bacterium]